MDMRPARGALRVWRALLRAQLREQPLRLALAAISIALGVALASSIFLVNHAALARFSQAARRLVGQADVIVRGPPGGFAESLFADLARDPAVAVASPILEIEAAVPGRRDPLPVLGLDPFRAGRLQESLLGAIGPNIRALWRVDGIVLSAKAAAQLHLRRGDALHVVVGDRPQRLEVVGVLPAGAYPQALGLMDIASAQWIFGRLGRLNRIDLRLADGVDAGAYRSALAARLPAGVLAIAPAAELDRAANATRAYRVNLNMLALVALWSGAFLVFSTQSLSVLRRRASLALLRALGVTRGQLEFALAAEGAALGAVGAVIGLASGAVLAAATLRWMAGDLGNGALRTAGAPLRLPPAALAAFFGVGVLVATIGAWLPARAAARRAPAAALKGGDGDGVPAGRAARRIGLAVCALGGLLAWLPPVRGLPLFGYAAIAALLIGAVLLVPAATVWLLGAVPRTGRPILDTGLAQLRDRVGPSTLSLASIIVSFSLMVAMVIMVHSFRSSFERWLVKLLPADIELRVPPGNDTAFWSAAVQARLTTVPGVARIAFRRTLRVALDREHAPVALIARDVGRADAPALLPLVAAEAVPVRAALPPAWISEAIADRYRKGPGDTIALALGGRLRRFEIAGIWRDYARSTGAIVVPRAAYAAATGDDGATEASMWLAPGADAAAVAAAARARFARGDAVQIMTSTVVRERSLATFDRAFAITYALEAVAVLIGLAGVGFAIGSTALARRAEFGLLRHVGLRRRDVVGLLAAEGIVLSGLGVLYGLALGVVLSLVLVFVVNRQSFGWSVDLAVPIGTLLALGGLLVAAAAAAAVWSGRAAVGEDALRAVREDW